MTHLLSRLLEPWADRDPGRDAVRCHGVELSYGALLQRANRLAGALAALGVRRGDRVAIYLHKGLESAVAIHGIWKAGAAYVPLDPLAPVARLAFTIRDGGVRHLVTEPGKADRVTALCAETALEAAVGLEADSVPGLRILTWADVATLAAEPPDVRILGQDLAYVMYTSGSTGTPKGLMHTHDSGLSYARASGALYGIGPDDRMGNHSPLHFDMSTFEFFTAPLCGATNVIVPEAYTKMPASMSALMEAERLTVWYSVPFALIQLLTRGALDQRDLRTLRWVNFGGEPFPAGHLRALMRLWPHARFSNVYGPAEVNQCTYYHVPPLADDQPIPIGRVWDDAEGLVLDEHDHEVAPGKPGELVVRTSTMMRGYWGRPDLNARAFYRRPVHDHYEDVFYRTGDLVQEQPDGTLRFLGRKDRQVKVRGHRLELDDVEAHLASHPAVEECAVVAVPDAEGSQRLEAAVRLRDGHVLERPEVVLRQHLASRVPHYAVPHLITVVGEFPRTASNKIDRRALTGRLASTATS
jgi:amino acid adenylation domain-containing protein